jgi:(1->4)-alpha-D-glucan 1-alpha-D-glucosylmutase
MLASSTHDTKRSEDVRARISLLSEISDKWKDAVNRWSASNEKYRKKGAPSKNTEWFLYQTMLGAWPIDTDRLMPYMQKAMREAKAETNWLSPNEDYEKATNAFINAIYEDKQFRHDFENFVAPLIDFGRIVSLSQTLFRLTSPGIPDMYQGTELWDLSLVDPDNRRPVDYTLRSKLLSELPRLTASEVLSRGEEGLPKLWIIHHALRLRREQPDLFGANATYRPLKGSGRKEEHLIAYIRADRVIALAPRLVLRLNKDWADTTIELPQKRWSNRLTGKSSDGGTASVSDLLSDFPVALLVAD